MYEIEQNGWNFERNCLCIKAAQNCYKFVCIDIFALWYFYGILTKILINMQQANKNQKQS